MNSGLARRIAFTIGALLVFVLGSHIPITGVRPPDTVSSGAIARVSIFAPGIIPV